MCQRDIVMENKRFFLRGDNYIWGALVGLCIASIIIMFSAIETETYSSDNLYDPILSHCSHIVISLVVAITLSYVPYKVYRLLAIPIFITACGLLIYTLLFAGKVNDAARWINVGISIQPSEIAKLGVIITTAYYLAKGQTEKGVSNNALKKVILVIVIPCLLIFTENLSTAGLIVLIAYCMMIIAGVSIKKLGVMLLIAAVFIGSILFTAHILDKNYPDKENVFMKVVHRANLWNSRITGFFSGNDIPEYEKDTEDKKYYQSHHSYMAIANGKGIGLGPGNSIERNTLPHADSDFIFAIVLEEYGILGGLVVMGLYLSLLFRTYYITRKCTHAFPAFLMMGLALGLVFQALLNMMVATGVGPVTGQPLPLISNGGSSAVFTGVYFGIMLNISHTALGLNNTNDKKTENNIEETNPNLEENYERES